MTKRKKKADPIVAAAIEALRWALRPAMDTSGEEVKAVDENQQEAA